MKRKILAFIPARGGSKGLPGKNIIDVNGKPLIAFSIRSGKVSKLVAKTIVSTDSPEIAAIAKQFGAEVPFLRPAKLATDTAPTIEAVLHALAWLENKGEFYDAVALLEPTSPLRKKDDIDNAIQLLADNWAKTDAVVSLGEIALESPYIAKKVEKGYIRPLLKIAGKSTRRQDLPRAYFPYGVIYLCKTVTLKKEKTFYPKRIMPYYIERWQNYEVDDIWNLVTVRAILGHLKVNGSTAGAVEPLARVKNKK